MGCVKRKLLCSSMLLLIEQTIRSTHWAFLLSSFPWFPLFAKWTITLPGLHVTHPSNGCKTLSFIDSILDVRSILIRVSNSENLNAHAQSKKELTFANIGIRAAHLLGVLTISLAPSDRAKL